MMQPMGRDPISGNAVPPGALPKEVRDDQPIMASEGEYVIPADVVRYIGLEKIESMVANAKKGLGEKMAQGRIGGKPAPSAPMPQREPAQAPVGMAEGGMVSPQGQGQMRAYRGPDGRVIFIPFFGGQPTIAIPEGFQPVNGNTAPAPAASPSRQGPSASEQRSQRGTQTPPQRGVDQWGVQDFISFGNQLQSGVHDAVGAGISALVPFGGLLTRLAENNMQNTMPAMLDNMIESGVDRQGNQINEADLQGLIRTRETMRDRAAQETGSQANPFERISSFFERIGGGGREQPSVSGTATQRQSPSEERQASENRGSSVSSSFTDPRKTAPGTGGMKSGFLQ